MRKRVNIVPDSEEEYDDEYEKKNEKTTTKNQEDDDMKIIREKLSSVLKILDPLEDAFTKKTKDTKAVRY